MDAAPFLPGLDLSRALYQQAVRPLLDRAYPGLRYAAARIGSGSEVLGYDTPRSTDHDWGPRLDLFLTRADAGVGPAIHRLLADRLPRDIHGWSTSFRRNPDPDDPVALPDRGEGPVNHLVTVGSAADWLTDRLGFDPSAAGPGVADWLATPGQRLLEVTAGAVFHDGCGQISAARSRLAFYPAQVWRYLLACQWQRLAQEEAFVGRCAEVGDHIGGTVIVARLARDLMRLALLMARRYPPYSKWLGTAFAGLPISGALAPHLRGALSATGYPGRQRHLCAAYRIVAAAHNDLGLTGPVDPACRPFHSRPYQVLDAGRIARALAATLSDPHLANRPLTGGVDQWADSTDLLAGPPGRLRAATGALG